MGESGQASLEYVGLVGLAALVLVGAGAVAGPADVAAAVAGGVRTGICIVGGDICRRSEAEAAGLEPCTVAEEEKGGGATVSVAWLRIGEDNGLTIATRSDGSVLITASRERLAGAAAGLGIEASPMGLSFGVEGKLDVTVTGGATWELPDLAAARRFLAGDRPAPTWRFGEVGAVLTGEAEAKLGGMTLTELTASAREAGGLRVGRGHSTLYFHGRLSSGAKVWTPGDGAEVAGPLAGEVLIELTLAHGEPREVAFRSVGRGAHAGQVVDTVARLDLRDPDHRAAAGAVLRQPGLPGLNLRPLLLYAVRHGTVERAVYDVRDESSDFELSVKLGAELGLQSETVQVQRRLVSASVWTDGSQERLREDCLM